MIKVTIELFPYGSEKEKRELSSFYIANDGTGSYSEGNYLFKKNKEDKWEPSVQGWFRDNPVELLVSAVIEQHYD